MDLREVKSQLLLEKSHGMLNVTSKTSAVEGMEASQSRIRSGEKVKRFFGSTDSSISRTNAKTTMDRIVALSHTVCSMGH